MIQINLQNRKRLIDKINKLMVTKGESGWGDKLVIWEQHIHIIKYKTEKQQGPTV